MISPMDETRTEPLPAEPSLPAEAGEQKVTPPATAPR